MIILIIIIIIKGANEYVAVNPETEEEGFYLAQLREDVFPNVQKVVHIVWLELNDDKKTTWDFADYDTIPCGSIICRVYLKEASDGTLVLTEAERQKILTLRDLDSEDEAAKEEVEKAKRAAREVEGDTAAQEEVEEKENEGEQEDEEDDDEKKMNTKKAQQRTPVLKKSLSRPLIAKEEEEEDKLQKRIEQIEDPTFAPGRKTQVAHRGSRVQSAKRTTARVWNGLSPGM